MPPIETTITWSPNYTATAVTAFGVDDGGSFTGNADWLGEDYNIVFRCAVWIPPGATITAAKLWVKGQAYSEGQQVLDQTIRCVDADNFGILTDAAGFNALALTTASAVLESYSPAWVNGTLYELPPDLSAIIQEVVDRPGWAAGNCLGIHLVNRNGSSGANRALVDNFGDVHPFRLAITYTAYTGFVKEIQHEMDCQWSGSGAVDKTSAYYYWGNVGAEYNIVKIFDPVPLANAQEITAARLLLKNYTNQNWAGATNFTFDIFGIDADDTALPANGTEAAALAKTTAKATIQKQANVGSMYYKNPAGEVGWDVKAIIEEITTRAGWNSGNALGFHTDQVACDGLTYWQTATPHTPIGATPGLLYVEYPSQEPAAGGNKIMQVA